MSLLIKGLDIDSHRVIKCFIVPYKDRAQLVIGNKYDAGKTYDIFEAPVSYGEWIKTTIAESCGTDELHETVYRDRETVKCSECGNPSPVYNIKFEFCPRCGARMDGGR
jgi:hypothetical protein